MLNLKTGSKFLICLIRFSVQKLTEFKKVKLSTCSRHKYDLPVGIK